MSEEAHEIAFANALPEGDVIRVLLEQHARIRQLFATVKEGVDTEVKSKAFDELRALLAVHETAEEMVLRPVTRRTVGGPVADARNAEESEANEVLARLEKMQVGSPEFMSVLADFELSVEEHAQAEESQEFTAVVDATEESVRKRMGTLLEAAEKMGPTHPHPTTAGSTPAQWTLGPFAAMADRARDSISTLMADARQ